jgi:hypothetical protein
VENPRVVNSIPVMIPAHIKTKKSTDFIPISITEKLPAL